MGKTKKKVGGGGLVVVVVVVYTLCGESGYICVCACACDVDEFKREGERYFQRDIQSVIVETLNIKAKKKIRGFHT